MMSNRVCVVTHAQFLHEGRLPLVNGPAKSLQLIANGELREAIGIGAAMQPKENKYKQFCRLTVLKKRNTNNFVAYPSHQDLMPLRSPNYEQSILRLRVIGCEFRVAALCNKEPAGKDAGAPSPAS